MSLEKNVNMVSIMIPLLAIDMVIRSNVVKDFFEPLRNDFVNDFSPIFNYEYRMISE